MKRVLNYMTGLESQLHYGVLDQETSEEKLTYRMAAVFEECYFIMLRGTKEGILRSSQCPQVKVRGRVEELWKSKRGTRGSREAEEEHMIGTTGGQKMYSRGIRDEQQKYNRGPTPWPYTELRIHNTLNSSSIIPVVLMCCIT